MVGNLFISYPNELWDFARSLSFHLERHELIMPSIYPPDNGPIFWRAKVCPKIDACDFLLFIHGQSPRNGQLDELTTWLNKKSSKFDKLIWVTIGQPGALPSDIEPRIARSQLSGIRLDSADKNGARDCANQLIQHFGGTWREYDGVPVDYIFDYEKTVIDVYRHADRYKHCLESLGCPSKWPDVPRIPACNLDNPNHVAENNLVSEELVGRFRSDASIVAVDARLNYFDSSGAVKQQPLSFVEAGPRKKIAYPVTQDPLNVAVVVSGGIAPGINAVIDGIRERFALYGKDEDGKPLVKLWYYPDGFKWIVEQDPPHSHLNDDVVTANATAGGSVITTSRVDELLGERHSDSCESNSDDCANKLTRQQYLEIIVEHLRNRGIDILFIIGGDGSMRAAHAIHSILKQRHPALNISIAGIPKTMDNDILWVWQSFGFISAVERARQVIKQLHTEVKSNPRLCVIPLFGSDSGFVVSHAALGLGSDVCDYAFIPEMDVTMDQIANDVIRRLKPRLDLHNGKSAYGLVVMAETAIPSDVEKYADDDDVDLSEREKKAIKQFLKNNRRVFGQTSDELRQAGLKIVSRVLERKVREIQTNIMQQQKYWKSFRVFTSEPRHLIRSMEPSVLDVILGRRLGTLAVDGAMAGYTDFMISQWLTEFAMVPLELVVLGRKRVPLDGIFWKSVVHSTGQTNINRPPSSPCKPVDAKEEECVSERKSPSTEQ